MKMNINKKIWCIVILIMMTFCNGDVLAFPLPTADMKRIGQNVKSVMLQVNMVKADVEHVRGVIRQIQQGGFAAAASTLFAEISSGRYDRYGNFLVDAKANAQLMGQSFKLSVSKKVNREKIREKIAKIEAERKKALAEVNGKFVDKINKKIAESEKLKAAQKAYKFIRKHKGKAKDLVEDGGKIFKEKSLKDKIKGAKGAAEDFSEIMKDTKAGKNYMKKQAKKKIVFTAPEVDEEIPSDLLPENSSDDKK